MNLEKKFIKKWTNKEVIILPEKGDKQQEDSPSDNRGKCSSDIPFVVIEPPSEIKHYQS